MAFNYESPKKTSKQINFLVKKETALEIQEQEDSFLNKKFIEEDRENELNLFSKNLDVKEDVLWKNEDFENFQLKRIEAFDGVEKKLNDIYTMISNAKNETIKYYKNNPDSFKVVKPTDLVMDYLTDIEKLLKGK